MLFPEVRDERHAEVLEVHVADWTFFKVLVLHNEVPKSWDILQDFIFQRLGDIPLYQSPETSMVVFPSSSQGQ